MREEKLNQGFDETSNFDIILSCDNSTGTLNGPCTNRYCSNYIEVAPKQLNNTRDKIEILFNNFKEFLKEKNKRYGDSALSPIQIFSKIDSINQLCNRLDDKLNRIKNSDTLRKNDLSDILGYISLLMIQNNWLEFEDLLD